MRRLALLACACISLVSASAQTQKKEKSATAWKTGGMFSLMGGQTGTRNYAPVGSEKFSLSGAAALNLFANKSWGKNSFDNSVDLTYGLVRTHRLGTQKVDDKIDLYSKFGHSLVGALSVGTVTNLRTQITNGYDYTESPRKRVSGFFAPAYLVFSPGVQLRSKNGTFGVHVGPMARWVIVTNQPYSLVHQGGIKPDGSAERTLADLYDVDPAKEVRWEAGALVSAQFKRDVMKNVNWRSRADLTFDIRQSNSTGGVDFFWTNVIGMTVNKWLKVNYNFDLYKDNNVRMFGPAKNETRTQLKSILGVGLGLTF